MKNRLLYLSEDLEVDKLSPTNSPAIFWLALFIAVGIILGTRLSIEGELVGLFISGLIFTVLLLRLFSPELIRPATLILFSGAFLLSAVGSGQYLHALLNKTDSFASKSELTVAITSDPQQGAFGWTVEAKPLSTTDTIVLHLPSNNLPFLGEQILVSGSFKPFSVEVNYERSQLLQGKLGTFKVRNIKERDSSQINFIYHWRNKVINELLQKGDLTLLCAILCGYKTPLQNSDLKNNAARTGLSHLMAVSGSHLVVIATLTSSALRLLQLRRSASFVILNLIQIGFVVFSGIQISAVRSVLMSFIASSAWLFRRRNNALGALGLIVIIFALKNPLVINQLSFQLSALSVAGISLFTKPFITLIQSVLSVSRSALEPIAITMVAQLVTAPLTIPIFGIFSLIGPLSNILIAPLISLLLIGGVCLAPFIAFGVLPAFLVNLLLLFSRFIESLIAHLSRYQFAAVVLHVNPYIILFAIVLFFVLLIHATTKKRKRILFLSSGLGTILLLVTLVIVIPLTTPPRVCVLDVGQAEAILVQDKMNELLIDTGLNKKTVEELTKLKISNLDAVLLTHAHTDHAGGLDKVLEAYAPKQIYIARGQNPEEYGLSSSDDRIRFIQQGDILSVGSFDFIVHHPKEALSENANEDAIIGTVIYNKPNNQISWLLLSDVEKDITHPLIQQGVLIPVDILKVAHHGSVKGTTARLIEATQPSLAVISAGENNRYGHPSEECLKLLNSYYIETDITIDSGTIQYIVDSEGLVIKTEGAP